MNNRSEREEIEAICSRLRHLEDIEAIRQLHYTYCRYMETGFDAEALGALWIEDGVWDGGAHGRHVGRAAIIDFFRRHSRVVVFSAHYLANEEVTLRGDSATCRCTGLVPATFSAENRTEDQWLFVTWNNAVVKREGRWLFESLRATVDRTLTGWKVDFVERA